MIRERSPSLGPFGPMPATAHGPALSPLRQPSPVASAARRLRRTPSSSRSRSSSLSALNAKAHSWGVCRLRRRAARPFAPVDDAGGVQVIQGAHVRVQLLSRFHGKLRRLWLASLCTPRAQRPSKPGVSPGPLQNTEIRTQRSEQTLKERTRQHGNRCR